MTVAWEAEGSTRSFYVNRGHWGNPTSNGNMLYSSTLIKRSSEKHLARCLKRYSQRGKKEKKRQDKRAMAAIHARTRHHRASTLSLGLVHR